MKLRKPVDKYDDGFKFEIIEDWFST